MGVCTADLSVDSHSCLLLHGVGDMTVYVECGLGADVADHGGKGLDVHAVFNRHGGEGVAEVVESYQRKLCVFEDHLQLAVSTGRADRLFGVLKVGEDPLGDRRLLFAFQQFSHSGRHLNTANTGLGLGLADADTAALLDRYRPLDLKLVFLEVDVLPPEAADLASAKSCHDLHVEEVAPVLMPLDGFEEGFQLIVTEDLLFGIVALGNGRAVCWIFAINLSLTAASRAGIISKSAAPYHHSSPTVSNLNSPFIVSVLVRSFRDGLASANDDAISGQKSSSVFLNCGSAIIATKSLSNEIASSCFPV